MNALEPGVRLDIVGEAGPLRVLVSEGGEILEGRVVVDHVAYVPSALVPYGAWRAPTPEEEAILLGPPEGSRLPGLTVNVLPFPAEVLDPFRRVDLTGDGNISTQGTPVRTPECDEAIAKAVSGLAPFVRSAEDLVLHGVWVQRGGLKTATTHRFGGEVRLTGMHIDRWHEGPYGCPVHAQMSINLGRSDRFFTFLNVTVPALVARLGEEAAGWLSLGSEFVRRHPRYPLVKVRVRPGEGYIAPTENIVHDITLDESTFPDVSLNLRGCFATRE